MKPIQNQTKIIQFEQNYVQSFFQDGTSMSWQDDTITYYSLKGNRIKLSIDTIQNSQDVCSKIVKVIQCQNRFNDQYIEIPKNITSSNIIVKHKKYKIKEFNWSQSLVKATQKGYEVTSDDNNAKFSLSHDLYKVNVQYLQLTSFRQISKQGLYLGAKNQRKFLLQKYSFQYNEFPTVSCSNEIENEYHLITKQFTIFNLPQRWCPPINIIWGYLLANELIPHPFCYIDFSEPQNKLLASIVSSQMPPFKRFNDFKKSDLQQQRTFQASSYPIYGKPNNNNKFRWMYLQREQVQMIGYACDDNNIFCERQGFWFIQGSKAIFNSKNKDKIDYQVNINAFPLTIRFQNQTQRQIKSHIIAFSNYLQHRYFIAQKQKKKPSKRLIDSDEDILLQQMVEGVGAFKAFKNYMVKGNFYDRIIVTMRESQIKVIDTFGKSWIVGNDPLLNNKYQWHINIIFDFYQKIFDPQAYSDRMRLNDMLEERKKLSNVFMQVTKHIQQNDC